MPEIVARGGTALLISSEDHEAMARQVCVVISVPKHADGVGAAWS